MPESIEISEKSGVRYLHFGADWIQGAMRIRQPNALELPYTREMMAGLILRDAPWPREVLMIGLGSGSLAKFIYHNLPETKCTVVEIDAQVEAIARQYFRLPDDPRRLRVIIADGAEYMLESGPSYEYILVDGFDKEGRAGALDTLPFYQACRARLSADGLLVVNLLGRSRGFATSVERLNAAFDERVLVFPSGDSGNAIAFATAGNPVDVSLDALASRAKQCEEDTGLRLMATLPRLQGAGKLVQGRLVI